VNRKPIGCILLAARNQRELLIKANQPTAANSNHKLSGELPAAHRLTGSFRTKTEPPKNSAAKTDRKIFGDALLPNVES